MRQLPVAVVSGPARVAGALAVAALLSCGGDGIGDDGGPAGGGDAATPADLAIPTGDLARPRDLAPPPPDLLTPRVRFADATTVQVGAQPLHVLLTDLDKDGKLDLVSANYGDPNGTPKRPSTLGVLAGQGNAMPLFKARPTLAAATGANHVAAADFDGDGKLDLAATSFDTDRVAVYRGKGDGTFEAAQATSPGHGPSSVAAADFNGDGKADLAVTCNTDNAVATLRGRGDGTFEAPLLLGTGGVDPFSVVAADMNGDGKVDLLVANAASGTLSVLPGNGYGSFDRPTTQYDVGASVTQVIAVDLDGDKKLDAAAANASEHSVSVLLGAGDGTLGKELRLQAQNGSGSLCATDLDLDGKLDLVVANHDAEGLSTFLGNGDGTFTAGPTVELPAAHPYYLACGDVDQDGRPDVIACDDGGFIAWILRTITP